MNIIGRRRRSEKGQCCTSEDGAKRFEGLFLVDIESGFVAIVALLFGLEGGALVDYLWVN